MDYIGELCKRIGALYEWAVQSEELDQDGVLQLSFENSDKKYIVSITAEKKEESE